MTDAQEKDEAPDPDSEADRGAGPQVFSGDKAELPYGLGEDGQDGLAVDLLGDRACGDEGAEEESSQQNRAESQVDEQLVIFSQGEGADSRVQGEQHAYRAQYGKEDGAPERLDKRIACDRE